MKHILDIVISDAPAATMPFEVYTSGVANPEVGYLPTAEAVVKFIADYQRNREDLEVVVIDETSKQIAK